MRLFDRFKQGEMRLTRVEAFSDGVFAIVVTLLVLELKVPALKDHASVSELAYQLVELVPKVLSWLISFLSPGAPRGSRNGNYTNGEWTAEAIEERRWLRSLVRDFAKTETGR